MAYQKAIFKDDKRKYYDYDIVNAFDEVGIKQGDVVFIHSDLSKFGRLADIIDKKQWNMSFLDASLDAVGKNGTLIVPTFTYSFCRGEVFDIYNSPSKLNYFTEVARTTKGFSRSEEPIFSVVSKGPFTQKMITNLSTCCLGKGSIFERLHESNAQILMLGFSLGTTFVHYVEEYCKVPYRYNKIFTGFIKKGDIKYEKSYTYYVRDLQFDPQISLENLFTKAFELGKLHKTNLGRGTVMAIKSKDLFNITAEMLYGDSYALVKTSH